MSALIPSPTIIAHLGLIFVVFHMLVLSAAFMVWMERKVCAVIQTTLIVRLRARRTVRQRLQADVQGQQFVGRGGRRCRFFLIARTTSTITSFAAFVVPSAPDALLGLLEEPIPLQVTDVNVAVLVIFAIASMGVYGIVLAGWASNSKYSLLGGLRSAATIKDERLMGRPFCV